MRLVTPFFVIILLVYIPYFCEGESRSNLETHDTIPIEIHRIIAVGDVHGDLDHFLKILSMADVIAFPNNDTNDVVWKPKWENKEIELHRTHRTKLRTTLVQMGDLIDRGANDLGVLEMVFSLFDQVKKNHTSDNLVLLLGNHELLNLQGQFYYVEPESMGGFLTKTLRKRAFEKNGEFGSFILENFTVLHLEDSTVFVHAGLNEQVASMGVEAINKVTKQAVQDKDYRHPLLGSSGPLWTRQMIMDAMNGHCTNIQKMLLAIGAERIVVGHTPQRSGHVETYCDDSVIAVDVGLSKWMYGNLAALEILVKTHKIGSGAKKSVEIREIIASDTRRSQTLDEALDDSLVLEELQHAVEEFRHRQNTRDQEETLGDL
ncbi:serine/threonine protein phosphatase [Trypanosoma theileri]|uniref:Serine/threonine protein phosphatase n=1 Tax=Trypanosoma theileri TaxID=67003 RepID=A0A1X0NU01_9TRYP|nr:serine/threonine protein phosphatase [Trypanosoma theileri]ORC88018.1 serine/threonine protein phosphatase [Trypanosoma theileri]